MKNRYIPPETKVVTFTARSKILESSYIGQGDGVLEARRRRSSYGFWDSEDNNESEESESLY